MMKAPFTKREKVFGSLLVIVSVLFVVSALMLVHERAYIGRSTGMPKIRTYTGKDDIASYDQLRMELEEKEIFRPIQLVEKEKTGLKPTEETVKVSQVSEDTAMPYPAKDLGKGVVTGAEVKEKIPEIPQIKDVLEEDAAREEEMEMVSTYTPEPFNDSDLVKFYESKEGQEYFGEKE